MLAHSVDYTSLNKPVKPVYLWLKLCGLAIIFCVAVGTYMTKYSLWDSDSSQANGSSEFFLAGILIAVIFACIYLYSYNRRHDRKLEAFANDNSWQRTKKNHDSAIAKTLEEIFDNITVNFDIEGMYNNHPIRLSQVECTPENLNLYVKIICLKIDLSGTKPFIILLSQTDKLDIANILAAKPNDGRVLQLEGNFKDTYKLFIKENTERDVLEVLTPDVMEELIDIQNPSSIALDGSEVCLFLPADDFATDKIKRIFTTVDIVIKALN
jgi:hypothetical protein